MSPPPTPLYTMDTLKLGSTLPGYKPDRLTLNPARSDSSIFTKGQLLQAIVRDAGDSWVWLEAGGRNLLARTEVLLQPQQAIAVKVTDVTPLRVSLQLQPPANPALPPQSEESSAGLAPLLTAWGLEADELNLTIAQRLLSQAHSITPEDIRAVRTMWRMLAPALPAATSPAGSAAESPGDPLPALVYLHSHQLPLSKEALALAQRWLAGSADVSAKVEQLQQTITLTLAQLQSAGGESQVFAWLAEPLRASQTQLANWLVTLDHPQTEISAGLSRLLAELGSPPEAKLAAVLASGGADPMDTHPVPGAAEHKTSPSLPVTGEVDRSLQPLHRLAGALRDALAESSLDLPGTQLLHRLVDQLNEFSNDLGAIHLANLAQHSDPTVPTCYFFPFPVATPYGSGQAHLTIHRQSGQAQLDPRNLRLSLLLDLPALGELAVHLALTATSGMPEPALTRHLTGQILSERPDTHQRVAETLATLQAGLSGLGYRIDGLTCELLPSISPTGPTGSAPAWSQLDLSV